MKSNILLLSMIFNVCLLTAAAIFIEDSKADFVTWLASLLIVAGGGLYFSLRIGMIHEPTEVPPKKVLCCVLFSLSILALNSWRLFV